jgi:hypothetical protein
LLGDISLGIKGTLGEFEITLESAVKFCQALVQVVLQLVHDRDMLIRLPVQVWVLKCLVDATLGELLQGRLESMSNGLVSGLEIPLTLVGGLDARVGKVLCSTSSRTSAAWLGGRGFGDGSVGTTTAAASSTTSTTASPSSASAAG